MGHTHAHESYLSLPLKPHDLKKQGNISLGNANVVHLVHINSVHEYDTYFIAEKIKEEVQCIRLSVLSMNTRLVVIL